VTAVMGRSGLEELVKRANKTSKLKHYKSTFTILALKYFCEAV